MIENGIATYKIADFIGGFFGGLTMLTFIKPKSIKDAIIRSFVSTGCAYVFTDPVLTYLNIKNSIDYNILISVLIGFSSFSILGSVAKFFEKNKNKDILGMVDMLRNHPTMILHPVITYPEKKKRKRRTRKKLNDVNMRQMCTECNGYGFVHNAKHVKDHNITDEHFYNLIEQIPLSDFGLTKKCANCRGYGCWNILPENPNLSANKRKINSKEPLFTKSMTMGESVEKPKKKRSSIAKTLEPGLIPKKEEFNNGSEINE